MSSGAGVGTNVGIFRLLVVGLLCALAQGCSDLPSSGPIARDVALQERADLSYGGYIVVDVDERVATITSSQPRESFQAVFRNNGPAPDLRIGVGDSVVVTIWEAAAGGLFSSSQFDRSATAGSRTTPSGG